MLRICDKLGVHQPAGLVQVTAAITPFTPPEHSAGAPDWQLRVDQREPCRTRAHGEGSGCALANASSQLALGLVVVGLAFKVGAVPARAWMPDVAEGAPVPAAAFVTAAPKVGALIALARLVAVLPEDTSRWRPLVAMLAALTMTLGNVAALWQDNVRRLLEPPRLCRRLGFVSAQAATGVA